LMPSILLIDDDSELLDDLIKELAALMEHGEAEIRQWVPTKDEADAQSVFNKKIDPETLLVVTDYDLTAQGRTGLFGASIVGWCQARGIPVGDFSRGNTGALPKEPNLFEVRVPTDAAAAAAFIAGVFRGFKAIRHDLTEKPDLLKKRSPAAVLAEVLGVPAAESQFALYGIRLGTSGAALMDRILRTAPVGAEPELAEKQAVLCYIVGHILLNAVLRFPGPILSSRALVAYVGSGESEERAICDFFSAARYGGPFSGLAKYFWLSKVDDTLSELMSALPQEFNAETPGEWNREALELRLGRKLTRHACSRCAGQNGGFLCPFTGRAVCQRSDCSVGSNSWIPPGAKVCRIERDFYEEWAPILGI
jgi:hypothetical protein